MKRMIMTAEIIYDFIVRRRRQLPYELKHKFAREHKGIESKRNNINLKDFLRLLCKGCMLEIKAGERVIQTNWPTMYIHDKSECVEAFRSKYKRMAYLVKDY